VTNRRGQAHEGRDVVAATAAFHRKPHRIDVTKISSEHFSVAATSGID